MVSKVLAAMGVALAMGAVACSGAPVETTGSGESAVVADIHEHCTGTVIGHKLASGDLVFVDGKHVRQSDIRITDAASITASTPACTSELPSPTADNGTSRVAMRSTGGCYYWYESEESAYGCLVSYSGYSCDDGSVSASFSSTC